MSAPMIENVKLTDNRYTRNVESTDRCRDLRVIHVLTRIRLTIDNHEPPMTWAFQMQLVKVLRVVG